MPNKSKWVMCAIGSLGLFSQSVAAQSIRAIDAAGQSEMRGVASLTIALGGARGSTESKPRIDFAMETSRVGAPDMRATNYYANYVDDRTQIRRTALSVTLASQPTFLLNGTPVLAAKPAFGADEDGESGKGANNTLLIAGGVVLLLGGAMVLVVTDTRDAVSDLIGPED